MTYYIQLHSLGKWKYTDDAPTSSYSAALNHAAEKYAAERWRVVDASGHVVATKDTTGSEATSTTND